MSDERYDRSADMRLLDLQREALGIPAHALHSKPDTDFDPLADAELGTDDESVTNSYVESGTILLATMDARPRAALVPGALVTISLAVTNDGDVAAREVRLSLALPLDTAYRTGTLSIDTHRHSDAVAQALFENGAELENIGPGQRRTVTLQLLIEAGTNDVILTPHLSAASGAVLGLRAMRLTRRAPTSLALVERPFYESDDAEHEVEPLSPLPPRPIIAVLQPREYPPVILAEPPQPERPHAEPPHAESPRAEPPHAESNNAETPPSFLTAPIRATSAKPLAPQTTTETAPVTATAAAHIPKVVGGPIAELAPQAVKVAGPVLRAPIITAPVAKAIQAPGPSRAEMVAKIIADARAKHTAEIANTGAAVTTAPQRTMQPIAESVAETINARTLQPVANSAVIVSNSVAIADKNFPVERKATPTTRAEKPKRKARVKVPSALESVSLEITRPKIEVVRSADDLRPADDRFTAPAQSGPTTRAQPPEYPPAIRTGPVNAESHAPVQTETVNAESHAPVQTETVNAESHAPVQTKTVNAESDVPVKTETVFAKSNQSVVNEPVHVGSDVPVKTETVIAESDVPVKTEPVFAESKQTVVNEPVNAKSHPPVVIEPIKPAPSAKTPPATVAQRKPRATAKSVAPKSAVAKPAAMVLEPKSLRPVAKSVAAAEKKHASKPRATRTPLQTPVSKKVAGPRIEVVRSTDDRLAFTGQGGPTLSVRIDRRRRSTLKVYLCVALPVDTAYQPGTLSIDTRAGRDAMAQTPLAPGAAIEKAGSALTRTLDLRLLIKPGTNNVTLTPTLTAESGALLDLSAKRSTRRVPTVRGFIEPLAAAPSTAAVAVITSGPLQPVAKPLAEKKRATEQSAKPAKIAHPTIDVVRSSDDRFTFSGQGGPMLSVHIDRRRLSTLTGFFKGASLGMIAHYLVLNALAARNPFLGDGTDDTIAVFVASQEQLLSRALIAMRLGKTPTPNSVAAALPAFPPALATHRERRTIDSPPSGEAVLFRAFKPAEVELVSEMLANSDTPPFLRAAQLFIGLCSNDAVLIDERDRRTVDVALTAYASLATAEIRHIFREAEVAGRAPDLFKATASSLDDAAKAVLAAIAQSIG